MPGSRLKDDATFRKFDALIRKPGDVEFRATLRGRSFGKEGDAGYGHFGVSHLLVIEQVISLTPPAKAQ